MDPIRFRSRILEAMGLGSAVLAGCAPLGGDAGMPVTARVDADVDVAAALEGPAGPNNPLPPPPAFLLGVSTFEVDRIATVDVTGAVPGADVFLLWSQTPGTRCPARLDGLCLDLGTVSLLDTAVTDANGDATLFPNIPPGLVDGSSILFQAVTEAPDGTVDVSGLVAGTVSHPNRTCTEHRELDPDLVVGNISDLSKWLVCTDIPVGGACEVSADFNGWRAAELFSDALGEVLPPNWTITALCDETSTTDRCCYKMKADNTLVGGGGGGNWDGRPFEVAGEVRLAPSRTADGWADTLAIAASDLAPHVRERLVARWADTAAAEHASVASFSRFNLELMSLGAPSSLLVSATRAIGDEIRHARFSYGVASALAGAPLAPAPLSVHGALDRSGDASEILVAAILEGCINETICAVRVRLAAEDVADPDLAQRMKDVADDESRHAELSWAFVRWMLESRPELRALAAATFDGWDLGPAPATDPDRAEMARFGVVTPDMEHAVSVQILRDVVRPCADRLLDRAAVADLGTC